MRCQPSPPIRLSSNRLGIVVVMKLVCPSCESGFLVEATALGPAGRKVRCGRCGNSWLAMPVEGVPQSTLAPPPYNLQLLCSHASISQPGGYEKCVAACLPSRCCLVPADDPYEVWTVHESVDLKASP